MKKADMLNVLMLGKTYISEEVKKYAAAALTGVMLLAAASCDKPSGSSSKTSQEVSVSESTAVSPASGSEDEPAENSSGYTVDNEEQAQRIITCSSGNLAGLEKIVLFEDRVVAVFDKAVNNKNGGFPGKGKIEYMWFSFNNLSPVEPQYKITKDSGKYILDASCLYEASDLIDPACEVKITGLFIKGKNRSLNIEIYADDLEISVYEDNHDSHTQYYDASAETWSEVNTKVYAQDSASFDEGISISWSLEMDSFRNESRVYEADGVIYKISSYDGRYITVAVENTGNETRTIGGTRYLQRVKGDTLIDLGRNDREMIIGNCPVKELPAVKIWSMSGKDHDQPWQRTSDPQFTLYGNETFEIQPGQCLVIEVLVCDFDIRKDGTYRLTFGGAGLDFDLEWEMVW